MDLFTHLLLSGRDFREMSSDSRVIFRDSGSSVFIYIDHDLIKMANLLFGVGFL